MGRHQRYLTIIAVLLALFLCCSGEKTAKDFEGWTQDETTGKWSYTGKEAKGGEAEYDKDETSLKGSIKASSPTHLHNITLASGQVRKYLKYEPETNNATSLVVFLSPIGEDYVHLACNDVAYLSNATGAVVVCPAAELLESISMKYSAKGGSKGSNVTSPCWRAFENYGYCYGNGKQEGEEDVDFIEELIQNVTAHHKIPGEKVIVSGFSNGGSMAYRVYCERSQSVGGVVVGGAAWFDPQVGYYDYVNERVPSGEPLCKPSHKRPIYSAVGTQDNYYGIASIQKGFEAVQKWHKFSSDVLNCTGLKPAVDTVYNHVGSNGANPPSASCYEYETCGTNMTGTGINKMCSVSSMGHEQWFMGPLLEKAFSEIFPNITINSDYSNPSSEKSFYRDLESSFLNSDLYAKASKGAAASAFSLWPLVCAIAGTYLLLAHA